MKIEIDSKIKIGNKIKVDKKVKSFIGIVCIVGVMILSALTIKEWKAAGTAEEEKINYTYNYTMGTDYSVNLRPNILYTEERLPEGQNYITEFVDRINVNFKTAFQGDGKAKVEGNYEIIAQVAGYEKKEDALQDIWIKEYILIPNQTFTGNEDYTFEKYIKVDYNQYNNFSKTVVETTKINLPTELRVIMRGNFVADTDYGKIEKPIQTSVVVPLGSNYFTIAKQGEVAEEDALKETITVPVPTNEKLIALYISGIVVVIALFISIMLFTTSPTVVEIQRKYIEKIFTTHGSRMVALDEIGDKSYEQTYQVHSIEDLVKIADELEKPIIYKYNKKQYEVREFYVIDKENIYTYEVKQKNY